MMLMTLGALPLGSSWISGATLFHLRLNELMDSGSDSSGIFSGWNGPDVPSISLVARATASAFGVAVIDRNRVPRDELHRHSAGLRA